MSEPQETCGGCAFWRQDEQDGQCKRYAPRGAVLVAPDEDFEAMTVWPWTSTDDWCGEWKQRTTDRVALAARPGNFSGGVPTGSADRE